MKTKWLIFLAAATVALTTNAAQFKFLHHTFTVPDGYELDLIARTPLVDRPISISFDDLGRLYATDSAGMSDKAEMDLLESIVYPSASFVRSYEPFTVLRKDGEDVTGILRKDAPDEIVLANGPETEARIARAEVTELRPGKVSLMPDGLEQVLTRQELADLLAFLKAAK